MERMKKRIILAMSLCMFLSLFTFPANVLAQNESYASGFETKEELIKFLNENGVPKSKQQILINKVEDNEKWDCYDREKLKFIPSSFYVFNPHDGSQTRYYRFEDGSFVKVETQLQDKIKIDGTKKSKDLLKKKIKDKKLLNKILLQNSKITESNNSDMPISTYGYESGSGYAYYWDWKISKRVGSQSAWFYAEFCNVDKGADYIEPSGCYGGEVRGFGKISDKEITVTREKEDTYRSRFALARLSWTANYDISTPWGGGSIGGGTFSLYLGVGNDTFYVNDRLPYK
ncbi:hypothetical protein [Dethiothermospora halolimnae]|uniref:hypothetical protein n=1 Tax=Dethiothermospora halolimnae TaxID=3114390 RepID=UPI003CCB75E1